MTPTRVGRRGKLIGMLMSGTKPEEVSETLSVIRNRIKKKRHETGTIIDRERSGRPVSVVTRKLKNAIKGSICRNPKRSIRKMVFGASMF